MIAPKKFDYICEVLPYLITALMLLIGGPAMLAGALQGQGVSPEVAGHFVTLLPWWVPIPAAILAGVCAVFLRMCYPSLHLPTTANAAQVAAAVQEYLAKNPQASQVKVTTPDMGPEHPSTVIEVTPPGPASA